ncbi:hypothetical protein [Prevotella nigrescens]|nr:hypothetical protein [Prevotella nigrescens]
MEVYNMLTGRQLANGDRNGKRWQLFAFLMANEAGYKNRTLQR